MSRQKDKDDKSQKWSCQHAWLCPAARREAARSQGTQFQSTFPERVLTFLGTEPSVAAIPKSKDSSISRPSNGVVPATPRVSESSSRGSIASWGISQSLQSGCWNQGIRECMGRGGGGLGGRTSHKKLGKHSGSPRHTTVCHKHDKQGMPGSIWRWRATTCQCRGVKEWAVLLGDGLLYRSRRCGRDHSRLV
jgi:hypothetical protein